MSEWIIPQSSSLLFRGALEMLKVTLAVIRTSILCWLMLWQVIWRMFWKGVVSDSYVLYIGEQYYRDDEVRATTCGQLKALIARLRLWRNLCMWHLGMIRIVWNLYWRTICSKKNMKWHWLHVVGFCHQVIEKLEGPTISQHSAIRLLKVSLDHYFPQIMFDPLWYKSKINQVLL